MFSFRVKINMFHTLLGNNLFHDRMKDILVEHFHLQKYIHICYKFDEFLMVFCRENQP